MRSIAVVTFGCAVALASVFCITTEDVDTELLEKQRTVLDLFQHIHQKELFGNYFEAAQAINLVDWRSHYTQPEIVDDILSYHEHGCLEFNEVFTVMNNEHRKLAIALFRLFYFADDWETFNTTMVWARFNVNEGMFVYATTVAVLHRTDMDGVILPAPYEIEPFYFFGSDVIQRAQIHKMQGFAGMQTIDNTITDVIPSNYTGQSVRTNPEQKLSYFTEDIGLNSHYYYVHADYPFWMGGDEYNMYSDRRGEFYFFQYQKLLARYHLERLSNDIGVVPEFSWYEPIKTGYYPALRYYNGEFFPSRDNHYTVYEEQNYYDVDQVEDYERHIRDAIEYGFITLPGGTYLDLTKPESIKWLGNFVQGNADSDFAHLNGGYFEQANRLLDGSIEPNGQPAVAPSVAEHFETAMRDPVFYQLDNKLIELLANWQERLTPYTSDDLNLEGVTIELAEIERLVTYFDKFDSDITNVIDIEPFDATPLTPLQQFGRVSHYQGNDIVINARQFRLNHLPFTYKLHVASDTELTAVVKAFIGPKYDANGNELSDKERRNKFYELDNFLVDLVPGQNVIVRNSTDFPGFVADRTRFYDLYKQVMSAVDGEAEFSMDTAEAHCGFPMRLMLPKGKRGGMPFEFFFIITNYSAPTTEELPGPDKRLPCGLSNGAGYIDTLPFGYPFDRPIHDKCWTAMPPNIHVSDVLIFHEDISGPPETTTPAVTSTTPTVSSTTPAVSSTTQAATPPPICPNDCSFPQCCTTSILNLVCTALTSPPADVQSFKAVCTSKGAKARCCSVPLAGLSTLCKDPIGA